MIRKIILILCVVLGLFAYDFFIKPPSFETGEAAPNFEATLIDDSPFTLSELRGNFVLLDFWGSWCGPCLKEIPELKTFHSRFEGQLFKNGEKLIIVSIALEKSDQSTRIIIQREGLIWPHHIIDVRPIVMMSPIAQKFDVKELPTKFLLNPQGEIMATNMSFEQMTKLLVDRI